MTEVSFIIPCLNEAESIGYCVGQLGKVYKEHNINGEIIVVDGGSNDGSAEFAGEAGARVVVFLERGYGNAIIKGFSEAKGRYLFMADADASYDFNDLPKLLNVLKSGYDCVNGSRLAGTLAKGSMSAMHIIGNKMLNTLIDFFLGARNSDPLSGFKGFTREALDKMQLKSKTWDLNVEIVMKIKRLGLKNKDVPVNYLVRSGETKLNSFDGSWRNVRFLMLYSPNKIFMFPGLLFFVVGLAVFALLFNGERIIFGASLGMVTAMLASLLVLFGFQLLNFGVYAKNLIRFGKPDALTRFTDTLSLEKILFSSVAVVFICLVYLSFLFLEWYASGFTSLPISSGVRALFAFTIILCAVQASSTAILRGLIKDRL